MAMNSCARVRGVFRKAADAIRGTNKPTTVPGFLRPIDTDRIAREVQLDRIAAERGGENLPSSTSNSLDAGDGTGELEARIAGEKSCCAPKVVSEKASRGCSAA